MDVHNKYIKFLLGFIVKYNENSYWKMRNIVVNSNSHVPYIIRLFYLLRIKRMDAFNNASTGTNLGCGAYFASPPILPHHLNGIIISPYANLGRNVKIYQQVTIAQDRNNRSAIIGDNVIIGAGVKIIGNVKIGNNVVIGANAVVVKDIPDNCTVVGVPARIIKVSNQ